jgi:hypothetical protein
MKLKSIKLAEREICLVFIRVIGASDEGHANCSAVMIYRLFWCWLQNQPYISKQKITETLWHSAGP